MEHSPGPWHLDHTCKTRNHVGISAHNHALIAQVVWKMEGDERTPRCEANARLMAAAPELLDALQTLLQDPNERAKAHAAIKKATTPSPSMRNVLPEDVYRLYAAYAPPEAATDYPARTLNFAFTWDETAEGPDYWEQIFYALNTPEAKAAYHNGGLTEEQKQELVFPKNLQRALRFYGLKTPPYTDPSPPYTDAEGFPALPGYEVPPNLKQMRNVLPECIFALFAANVKANVKADDPAKILMQTFTWLHSPEGDAYWRRVYEALKHPAMQAAYLQNFLTEEQKNAIFASTN